MSFWDRFSRRGPPQGAATPRRIKTYSAENGQAYQYQFREVRKEQGGLGYVFDVTSRRAVQPVTVFLPEASTERWEAAHGRTLTSTERYAIAKIFLLRILDASGESGAVLPQAYVQAQDVGEITLILDL